MIVGLVTQTLTKNTFARNVNAWMLKTRVIKISWSNFPSSKMFILKDCTLCTSSKGPFFENWHSSSIHLWSRSISLSLACGLVTMVSWYPFFFLVGSQIGSHGVSCSILMHRNFGGWFSVGHLIFGLLFLVTSFNSFFYPTMKCHNLLWVDLGLFQWF